MIFQGPGNRAGLTERLEALSLLEDWQLKNGPFQDLTFRGKQIRRMSSERAVLDGSRFGECRLEESEFLQSNLQETVFEECLLEAPVFTSCQMRSSRWERVRLREPRFKGCAAPRMEMLGSVVEKGSFEEVEVNRGNFGECCFFQTAFQAEHSSGTTGFRNSRFRGCLFLGCFISGSALAFASLEECVFVNCRFFQTDWDCTQWRESRFRDCTGGPERERPFPAPFRGARVWREFEQEVLGGTA